MHGIELLHDLAVVMLIAGVTTIFCHRFKQPVALGYIVAGFIIGPGTPFTLVHDEDAIKTLGEMGVVLLMFSLGLEFSLRRLSRVGLSAFVAALLEIVLMIWLGYEVGRAFGWNTMDSVFLGAMLSISSTTIIVKALAELGKSRESFAEIIFGILVIEDILAIILLALLSGFARTGSLNAGEVGVEVLKLAVFFAMVLVVGLIGVPRLFDYIARFKSNEMLLIAALGLCFGIALLATVLNYSVALGAFLIGAVIAESRQIHQIESLTTPVRDMFSAIFFVTIGMLIEPKMLVEYAWPIVVLSLLVIVGKVVTCSFGVFVGGKDLRTSLSVGLGLAQIGEFSFIIATLGLYLNVTSSFLYPIAVAVSVITTLATPYLIRATDGLVGYLDRSLPRPLLQALSVYTAWIGSFGQRAPSPQVLLVRRMGWQLLINLLLTFGLFALGAWATEWTPSFLPEVIQRPEVHECLIWIMVMIATSPIYLASARKIQAMSILIAEICVPIIPGRQQESAARLVIAQMFVLASFTVMTFLTVLLSTTILSSLESMIPLLLVMTVAALLFRPILVRIYSRAEIALHETLVELPLLQPHPAPSMPDLLREAELETVEIPSASVIIGRCLREIPLRIQTGASIVAIERAGQRLINPGPDEILRAGDRVLLLGQAEQLPVACDMLVATAAN
ncbi:MAG: cation:proton antiporter [Methylacidiphilales bacterium]|nr:cation:proton antiporter [Candidatus Methylacidiphilales bacterium]